MIYPLGGLLFGAILGAVRARMRGGKMHNVLAASARYLKNMPTLRQVLAQRFQNHVAIACSRWSVAASIICHEDLCVQIDPYGQVPDDRSNGAQPLRFLARNLLWRPGR